MEHELKDRINQAEIKFGLIGTDKKLHNKPKKRKFKFYYDSYDINGDVIEHRIFIYAYSRAEAEKKLKDLGYKVYTKR